ncbi:MAG: hypothetical protein QM736_22000 [Vicinamibacterales bacterium]
MSSRPTSRAISSGYWVWLASISPPPPKQPQSIEMPRAHTEAIPMMNASMSNEPITAETRVNVPVTRSRPTAISTIGSAAPTKAVLSHGRIWYSRTDWTDASSLVTLSRPATIRVTPRIRRVARVTHSGHGRRDSEAAAETGTASVYRAPFVRLGDDG